ncbi:MAG: cell division protein ZapA [Endomicrobia bacterium]|nr:cell division protein ZapA [Endomicrobiia bacterium]
MKQEGNGLYSVKIGTQEIYLTPGSPIEKLFIELVADYVNKKFIEFKQKEIDTIRSYATTLLEIAKEKFSLEKKIEEKINSLELKISSIIEDLDRQILNSEKNVE